MKSFLTKCCTLLGYTALTIFAIGCTRIDETALGIGVDGLRLERFSATDVQPLIDEEIARQDTPVFECTIYLKPADGTDYVFAMNGLSEDFDVAFMKVNGEWITFRGILEPTRFPLPLRDFTGSSNQQGLSFSLFIDDVSSDDSSPSLETRELAVQIRSSRDGETLHRFTVKPAAVDTSC